MAPEANGEGGNGGSSAMEAAENKKPRKRKKSRSSSSSVTRSATSSSSSMPTDGDGNGGQQRQPPAVVVQQQQQLHRGKPRVVWTADLHAVFLEAYDALGKDAVPKKILAFMNVDGISREHVASHLQKHRLNLKREEQRLQRVPGREDERRPHHHAEYSSQTPLPSLHPPDQAPAASSSLHPPPQPQPQPPFASLTMSGLQIAEDAQQQLLHQTPPPDCFTSNSSSSVPTNLLLHQHPSFPMVQPMQQCFTPPLQATIAMPPKTLVEKLHAGHNNNATMQQQAAAAASGYNPMLFVRNLAAQPLARAPQMQAAPQVVSTTGEISVHETNSVNDEEADIRSLTQLLMAVETEDGQGRPAEREAASEMATTRVEEGQGQAAEPGAAETTAAAKAEQGKGGAAEPGAAPAAAAGSLNPASTSIHGEYWKIDDTDVSWDFSGFHDWCKSD
ncbi:unnamed protein product [Urochloa humidicola]